MDEDKPWYEDLKDYAVEQVGGIQTSGQLAGVDFTVGRLPGPSWPAVTGGLLVILLLVLLVSRG